MAVPPPSAPAPSCDLDARSVIRIFLTTPSRTNSKIQTRWDFGDWWMVNSENIETGRPSGPIRTSLVVNFRNSIEHLRLIREGWTNYIEGSLRRSICHKRSPVDEIGTGIENSRCGSGSAENV